MNGSSGDRNWSRRLAHVGFAILALGATVLAGAAGPTADRGDFDATEWLQDSDGLVEALQKVEAGKQDLVVYFYADWCGYCRQFERELLGTPKVRSFLRDELAVMINPDRGTTEQQIARYYGVEGYPAFFVYARNLGRMVRVERFRLVGGRPELLSPDEFVAAIKDAAAR